MMGEVEGIHLHAMTWVRKGIRYVWTEETGTVIVGLVSGEGK